jgi:flagellar export protein FliJ
MARFRFRAQAALDLRLREYQLAQRELAERQRDLHLARTRSQQAAAAVDAAQEMAAEAQAARATLAELDWYRFWIVRLVHERQASALHVTAREQRVSDAAAACQRAHQRCEALEKFREKARRAHDAAESATERKLIDELATRRYAAARAVRGEQAL